MNFQFAGSSHWFVGMPSLSFGRHRTTVNYYWPDYNSSCSSTSLVVSRLYIGSMNGRLGGSQSVSQYWSLGDMQLRRAI